MAGYQPVQATSKNAEPPIWNVVEVVLKAQKVIKPIEINNPKLLMMDGKRGLA